MCAPIHRGRTSSFSVTIEISAVDGQPQSGVANLGNTISGWYNTSPVGILTSAFNSGIKNVGQKLAGFFRTGTGP
ncbi:hypothetical protein B1987_00665 [Mycobacterium kansasii]|nr:hypothetical protein B1987_00665 [Mycobacterium kansasii]